MGGSQCPARLHATRPTQKESRYNSGTLPFVLFHVFPNIVDFTPEFLPMVEKQNGRRAPSPFQYLYMVPTEHIFPQSIVAYTYPMNDRDVTDERPDVTVVLEVRQNKVLTSRNASYMALNGSCFSL